MAADRHVRVVQELGARIVRLDLPAGTLLPTEDVLAGELAVGRSAVREGVKVLAGKGLVETRRSAGTRVRARETWNLLDADVLRWRFAESRSVDLAMIADLRVALEPGAARLAAESTDLAARRAVGLAMSGLWATVEDADEEFVRADLAFHRAVFVAAGNDLLLHVHDQIEAAFGAVRPLHSASAGHNRETLAAHEEVAAAVLRGHHRKAETAMRAVVEGARADLLERDSRRGAVS
ncbi:FadR/GntR family transcriptional regulator [Nocardioides mangrovi]|uniref:FCD domain-containing protein n=1 Tax=Nocardioides mangrovi TaxID=2874580 RepID=A0ABS7UIX0_9ACTN|nr:FCD domain-containing protein [Nocardioides mangrovi]MBZ5740981.1 FCD domain-containing protein [Nocardioides mangrovi]